MEEKFQKWLNGHKVGGSGIMFVGSKGDLFANYGSYKYFPKESGAKLEIPKQTIPNSIGHYNEWIKACKDGSPTTCNFDYSGCLTESVLLGNVAFRTGKKLAWDGKKLEATNCKEAAQYVKREYRKGWSL